VILFLTLQKASAIAETIFGAKDILKINAESELIFPFHYSSELEICNLA